MPWVQTLLSLRCLTALQIVADLRVIIDHKLDNRQTLRNDIIRFQPEL